MISFLEKPFLSGPCSPAGASDPSPARNGQIISALTGTKGEELIAFQRLGPHDGGCSFGYQSITQVSCLRGKVGESTLIAFARADSGS